jgi:hypothetical protein
MARNFGRTLRPVYEVCRKLAADNFSEFYIPLHNRAAPGPRYPRGGAGHRCAYWQGRLGHFGLYHKFPGTQGYAAWAAGADDRKADLKRKTS